MKIGFLLWLKRKRKKKTKKKKKKTPKNKKAFIGRTNAGDGSWEAVILLILFSKAHLIDF
jgi:hypothetical protein